MPSKTQLKLLIGILEQNLKKYLNPIAAQLTA